MRVMFDTNVLVSAGLFSSSRLAALAERVSDEHTLVLSSQIIDELRMVMNVKFPQKKAACEAFLNRLSFEMVLTPRWVNPSIYPRIRDKSDYRDSQAKAPGFIPGMKRSSLRPARRSRARLLPSDGAHGTTMI